MDSTCAPKRPKFQSLEFNYKVLTSTTIEIPKSAEKLTDVNSLFTRSHCSAGLASLLGVSGPSGEGVNVEHWQRLLVTLGAVESSCPLSWCKHIVLSAVQQAYFFSVRTATSFLSPTTVGLLACLKYNREVVEGERPVLRKMTEGDVSAAALSVLYLSAVRSEQLAPHTKVVTLSDGFYHLKATLDIPLSNLIREGVLLVGQKLAVCGAKLRLSSFSSPSECAEEVCFALNYNCVRPVTTRARLGLCHHDPDPLCIRMVHPSGGMVPAIRGVVKRALPPFFISPQKESTVKILRNRAAHYAHVDREVKAAPALPATELGGDGPAVSRVTSVLLEDENGDEAVIQQWETCTLLESTREDDGHEAPKEGSTVVVFALNPSKSNISAAPFPKAKTFNCSRSMQYTCLNVGAASGRGIATCAAEMAALTMGCVADVAGIFLELRQTDQGTLALLLLQDDTYALLQVPVASPARVLSLGWPTAKGSVIFVLHGTFVSATDETTGSDCARLFANEYTLVSQRLQHVGLQRFSDGLKQKLKTIDLSSKKYLSRCEDILSSASAVPVKARSNPSGSAVQLPFQNAGKLQRGEARVPYYLRTGHEEKSERPSMKGVVISAEAAAPAARVPLEEHTSLYHFYGNITQLRVVCAERATVLFTSESVAGGPPVVDGTRPDGSVSMEITWQFGKLRHEVLSAVVREPSIMEAIISSVVSFEKIGSLIVDERSPEIGIKREEVLFTHHRSLNKRNLWWSVFTQSYVVSPHTTLGEAAAAIPWSPSEWADLLTAVKERLRCALYKFALKGGELTSAYFVTEQCSVNSLFE
ncbi:DNA repair protein BRCA2 [Strigomonas culicis]|nr:DNA repair protein BRCA2 [Strigomonas culicis]|eukprot:EPY20383.1 DNA repair protein BRCA2 [Strigomonas culicis]